MAYELIVTEHADELLDNLVHHLLYRLKSEQAPDICWMESRMCMNVWKKILCNFRLAEIHTWQIKVTMKRLCHKWIICLFLV